MSIWPSENGTEEAAAGRDHEGQGMAEQHHSAYRLSTTLNNFLALCVCSSIFRETHAIAGHNYEEISKLKRG